MEDPAATPPVQPAVTDTIPRLNRIADHARDQIIGLASGATTFEDCRLQYLNTQQRLNRQGRGRITASRAGVGEAERNWSPTRDCLQELMRWKVVEAAKLPSERKFLDRYRDQPYELTDRGRQMAAVARDSRAAFTDEAATCLIDAHPYLHQLITALDGGRVTVPFIGQGDISRGRKAGTKTADWAVWGAERISGDADRRVVERELRRALGRFRNRTPDNRPSDKEIAEAMNDGFTVAGCLARGVPVDATSVRTLIQWGLDLLLFDNSRHVPGYPQTLVLWGCSDLTHGDDGRLRAARRGKAAYGERVAVALTDSYRQLAEDDGSSLAAPFLPIHRIRAQAAEQTGVTRALADKVLADIIDGQYPDVGDVSVFVGSNVQLPSSEPAFRYRGGRRMVMQVNQQDAHSA